LSVLKAHQQPATSSRRDRRFDERGLGGDYRELALLPWYRGQRAGSEIGSTLILVANVYTADIDPEDLSPAGSLPNASPGAIVETSADWLAHLWNRIRVLVLRISLFISNSVGVYETRRESHITACVD